AGKNGAAAKWIPIPLRQIYEPMRTTPFHYRRHQNIRAEQKLIVDFGSRTIFRIMPGERSHQWRTATQMFPEKIVYIRQQGVARFNQGANFVFYLLGVREGFLRAPLHPAMIAKERIKYSHLI